MTSLLNLACGYRLAGRGRNLPAGARTIAIPDFINDTSRQQAGRFVSEAIRKEFITRSHLRLGAAVADADLVLEGRINTFETIPTPAADRGSVAATSLRITVSIRVIDMKKNELFYEGTEPAFPGNLRNGCR